MSTNSGIVSGDVSNNHSLSWMRVVRIAFNTHVLSCLAWLLVFCAVAVVYGPDASWDFRNYHFYGPFALFHGRLDFDLAPAQPQTFFPPTLDIPSYWLRSWLNNYPDLLDALLSLPNGIGAYLATLIALRFVPSSLPWRWPVAMLLAAVGVTGTAGLPTVATTQSEMLPGCLALGGFLLLLRQLEAEISQRALVAAGLMFGAAVGLKLTSVPYSLGAIAALLLSCSGSARVKLMAALVFSLGVFAGMTLLAGWWWLHLWAAYGSPLFPLYNGVFRSPYIPPITTFDNRFKPTGVLQALFYPFYWGFSWRHPVAEVVMRDPRFMLAYLAFWITVVRHVFRFADAASRQIGFLLVFFGVSYIAWEAEFSVLRYLAPLEVLCGVVIFLPFRALISRRHGMAVAGFATTMIVAMLLVLTVYPKWGRAQPRTSAISVHMPPLKLNSLVLLLDGSAMSYFAAFVPPSARIVGANNATIHPGQKGLLEERAEQLIRTYPGPIYGMENPREAPGVADRTLTYYRLHRGTGCARVPSNLDFDGAVVCPLVRDRP